VKLQCNTGSACMNRTCCSLRVRLLHWLSAATTATICDSSEPAQQSAHVNKPLMRIHQMQQHTKSHFWAQLSRHIISQSADVPRAVIPLPEVNSFVLTNTQVVHKMCTRTHRNVVTRACCALYSSRLMVMPLDSTV
jgi:hypothetical protein